MIPVFCSFFNAVIISMDKLSPQVSSRVCNRERNIFSVKSFMISSVLHVFFSLSPACGERGKKGYIWPICPFTLKVAHALLVLWKVTAVEEMLLFVDCLCCLDEMYLALSSCCPSPVYSGHRLLLLLGFSVSNLAVFAQEKELEGGELCNDCTRKTTLKKSFFKLSAPAYGRLTCLTQTVSVSRLIWSCLTLNTVKISTFSCLLFILEVQCWWRLIWRSSENL